MVAWGKKAAEAATWVVAIAVLAIVPASPGAHAADYLRIGKSPAYLFAYVPLEIAKEKGLLEKQGIEIETIAFEGAAKMDLGMISGSVDITLGGPTEMAAIAKGMPAKAVAVIARPVRELAIVVPADSPIRSLAELRGKSIGIASAGSITQWAALELARVQGWGPEGITLVSIGSGAGANAAALRTHQVDATVANIMTGVVMEKEKQARRLALVADYASDFIMHEMCASNALIAANPEALKRFLGAWFAAVDYMREHKAETIAAAMPVTGLGPEDEAIEYDLLMPELTRSGRHEAAMMERVAQSFLELKLFEKRPDMETLYSNDFLP